MKWIGACLVTLSCTGLGQHMAGEWKRRLKCLEQLRQMMYLLKAEILYGHTALGEALRRVGQRCRRVDVERGMEALPLFFLAVAARIEQQEGESFSRIWQEELEKMKAIPLKESDTASLENLGAHLGYLDLEMQERNLLLYLEQVDGQIAFLKQNLRERTKLYTSLGIMGGLFLSIIMY